MNEPQPVSPRRRLQALLAIPDSQRTDAEWDELNELEISLAPGNRIGGPEPGGGRRNAGDGQPRNAGQPRQARQPKAADQQAKPGGNAQQQPKKPGRKFHKRSSKPKAPPAAE